MKNVHVSRVEFLKAVKRNALRRPLIVFVYNDLHFWFYTNKVVWVLDFTDYESALALRISLSVIQNVTIQEEKDR